MFGGNKYKNGDPKKTSCLTPECYKYITIAILCVIGMIFGAVFTVFFPDLFTAVLKQVIFCYTFQYKNNPAKF